MIRRVTLSCLLTATLLHCQSPVEPPPEIVLGLIAPFNWSDGTVEGARLAVETINDDGGLRLDGGPRRLRLVVEDSDSSPEVALSKALKLINTDGVAALVGVPISGNAIPVARLAEEREVPLITTKSTHPETTSGKRHVFRMTFLDSIQGRTMAEFAHGKLRARRAAVLTNVGSAYSTYIGDLFQEVFRRHGGEVVAAETFTEDSDVTRQLERIHEAAPDVLFLPYLSLVGSHMEQARALGIEATFLGADAWDAADFSRLPVASGSYFSDVWAPDASGEASQEFIRRYRESFGKPPTNAAVLSHDAILLLAEVIRSERSASRASIRHGLAALDRFEGVSGAIEFDDEGNAIRSVFVRRVEEGGDVRLAEIIEP